MLRHYVFLLLLACFTAACNPIEKNIDNIEKIEKDSTEISTNEFGLEVDSLIEYTGKVKKYQTISDILLPFDLSYGQIDTIYRTVRDTFDFRKLKPGKNYSIYYSEDSLKHVDYYVYQIDPVNFFVIDLKDSLNYYTSKKEIEIRERKLGGIIESSLYETLDELDVSPQIAIALSEVYAWQIDFYRIQKGDNFRVIYEEKYVDDKFVGLNKVIATEFEHFNDKYIAIGFDEGEGFTYFDETGASLRKEFLKSPVKFSRISSGYSYSRMHPILKRRRPHLGIDFAAPYGTPVRSVGDGVVIKAQYSGGAGHYIKIRHNSTYQSGYMHLSKYAKGIKRGTKVRQGDIIGYVGSTGLSTGPHLDFRFWKGGSLVNYLRQKFPPTKPLNEKYLTEFKTISDSLIAEINKIKFIDKKVIASEKVRNNNGKL